MHDRILLAHGSGGKLSHDLVNKVFLPRLDNPVLARMNDGAVLEVGPGRLAMTTDSFVVKPLFFPGADIGRLAVCGTVNDISMQGGRPIGLTAGFIIEEGLPMELLERVINSMRQAADEAGVSIVAGDTKVVEKGACDQLFINTAGVGLIPDEINTGGDKATEGDVVIVSGTIGDHGIAVMAAREGMELSAQVHSDAAPLNKLVATITEVCPEVHVLRDPTRGGLATTLNEIAGQSGVTIELNEEDIPASEPVRAACEIFGFDPLYLANEGKLIAIVPENEAEAVLEAMRGNKYGENARIVGKVSKGKSGLVVLNTLIGGQRILDMLTGEQLPRIC